MTEWDFIIVGAGSAGAALAYRLSEDPSRRVLLLEAGPNHTSAETPDSIRGKSIFAAVAEPGRIWPALTAVCANGQAPTLYLRGRGVGGSSAVNAQVAIRGLPGDYDRWAAAGCVGWGWDGVRDSFERVAERIPVERRPDAEWSTLDKRLLAACVERGHPRCDSYETEGVLGIAPAGLTRRAGRRVSTNDAYLDAARARPNLEIRGGVLVDRVLVEHGRATGVRTSDGNVAARHVALSAGAIHSPAILLRSGLDALRPGIGRNLAEHPKVFATLQLAPGIVDADGDTPGTGFILRWSSGVAGCSEGDLQILSLNHDPAGPEIVRVLAAVMEPFSRGAVTLVSDDPEVDPRVEFRLLSDTRDAEGMRLAAQELLALVGNNVVRAVTSMVTLDESGTTPDDVADPGTLDAWLSAILDSGIRWQDPLPDLVNKFYLNRRELPVPEASANTGDPYDRNQDGLFNIEDYLADGSHEQDSRVSDQNGNGVIDPEDLIFIFSDGVDDDANGYTDDISGWDFFEDDNDPLDEVRYGHGTGQSEDSGAEANNGAGGPGSCPNCLLLEVRVGDSFVAEINAFAQGVVFAVDSGANVVQEALGALNHSRFGQDAVDYAYENGVVVIASAADEESNHHNYPANYQRTVEVNSVTRFAAFGPLVQSPASYLYLNGCTNYGGHIALAVPSSSCSSEATGRAAGMAGLVVSAALNAIARGDLTPYRRDDASLAPFPLSAEEVKQVLIGAADDINFDARPNADPPLDANYNTLIPVPGVQASERFRSAAGWDQYFGYGRINADRSVRAVAEGRIPPEASFSSPEWFDIIDPAEQSLTITGRVAANRADSYSYTVEVAPGIQPSETEFTTEVRTGGNT